MLILKWRRQNQKFPSFQIFRFAATIFLVLNPISFFSGEGGIRSQINFLTVRKGVSKLTVSVPRLDFLLVQKLQKMLNRASNPSSRHKQLRYSLLISLRSFGEGGIRTLDTEINPYNRLATCRLQP